MIAFDPFFGLFLLGAIRLCYPFQTAVRSSRFGERRSQLFSSKMSPQLVLSLSNKLGPEGPIDLVLASQSPRRREILDMMGLKDRFTVTPSSLDEEALQQRLKSTGAAAIDPVEYTCTLAKEKAKALAVALPKGQEKPTLILGSDTIVAIGGKILEKPKDSADAKRMLLELSGSSHSVHTGVAIYMVNRDGVLLLTSFVDTAKVSFSSLQMDDIEAYIRTGEPMDKAGAYGIQGIGGQFVESIEGDFFTVSRLW